MHSTLINLIKRKMKIGIINYGCGNISNIIKALNRIGAKSGLIERKKDISNFEKIILPGMGSASHAMNVLKKNKLDIEIKRLNRNMNPILGICLGFQLSLQSYEISLKHKIKSLSLIKGNVKRIEGIKLSLPIINWLKLKSKIKNKDLSDKEFYFAHEYYCNLDTNEKNVTFVEMNNKRIISSYENKNLYFYQFHPELSGQNGLNLLNNFNKL